MVVSNLPQEEKQFRLLGHEDFLREIETNAYATSWELSKFVYAVRKMDKSEYPPSSLYLLCTGLQRYLRETRAPELKIFESPHFKLFQDSLDAEMKRLTVKGLGCEIKQAEPITDDEERLMWTKGVLDDTDPKTLLNTLFFLIEKNYAGGLKHRKLRPKTVEQHDNPGKPERCIVRIFEKYQSKCPKLKPGSPLYLTPKRKVSSDDEVLYTKTPVGKNTLRKVVQDMCRVAEVEGYKTNHSLRATTCKIGLEKGVPEKLIMERTGNRTVKSFHSYQRVSDAQNEIVSDVLQGSAIDFSGASVESDEPPTKKIRVCAPKENIAQFNE
ncbi:zinc finger MYM-type protein 2-like [Montipora foliosa]|uniref:zinc finger MYM-type protein 2-like n=1 Tax=Montipora foliosa TaxID=591990 RepID=UPI0035F10E2E